MTVSHKSAQRNQSSKSAPPRMSGYVGLCLAFSLVVNILMLVSPLYMLQVYDRIMTSGSMDALIWLSVMAISALAVYAAAEAGRRRVLSIAGETLSENLSHRCFEKFLADSKSQPRLSHDLSLVSRLQSVVQSGLPTAFCDLPFAPLFLILLTLLHPILGAVGLVGVAIIISIAIISELHSRKIGNLSLQEGTQARRLAQGIERQRSAISTMGLGYAAKQKWNEINEKALSATTETTSIDGIYSGMSRTVRQILQVLALGVGGALAINQQISAGGIVAGSILMGRALAPIDQIVGGWRNLIRARAARLELRIRLLDADSSVESIMPLPKPTPELEIQRLAVRIPGMETDLIRPFSHKVKSGEIVAVLGGNGSGKTTLLQTLAGAWSPHDGIVRLGGRDLHDWDSEDRGTHVGYLPQNIELLPGTVRENVGRLSEVEDEEIFKATRFSGAHETILRLPKGYETPIGPGGQHLSAGQTQMVGLARAFFGAPSAIFLDEPSANLDHQGVARLSSAMKNASASGVFIVLSTHDPRLLRVSDTVLIIRDGAVMSAPAVDYLKAQNSPVAEPAQRQVS